MCIFFFFINYQSLALLGESLLLAFKTGEYQYVFINASNKNQKCIHLFLTHQLLLFFSFYFSSASTATLLHSEQLNSKASAANLLFLSKKKHFLLMFLFEIVSKDIGRLFCSEQYPQLLFKTKKYLNDKYYQASQIKTRV